MELRCDGAIGTPVAIHPLSNPTDRFTGRTGFAGRVSISFLCRYAYHIVSLAIRCIEGYNMIGATHADAEIHDKIRTLRAMPL